MMSTSDKQFVYMESEKSDDEHSDISLKIVEDNPRKKKHIQEIPPGDKAILSSFENEFEEKLQEKADKSKLTAVNVKHILKHVVTNEHVIALMRNAENPDQQIPLEYEPKLTRAKAKKLFNHPINAWSSPNSTVSETQVLISEEFSEDSSGDEYIPAEESEDDKESSVANECNIGSSICKNLETTWSEDGIFKLPHNKTKEEIEEEANIALRTRSKLCLSDTPLEVIAEAFIPPDITTDMYEIDCDDDNWTQFLKEFTQPLEEVSKTEDEDHDPEYNVLADEEIDKVDEEELRADRGVKVSKKELNALIAELAALGEYTDYLDTEQRRIDMTSNSILSESKHVIIQPALNEELKSVNAEIVLLKPDFSKFSDEQYPVLEQQLRQHVQMLTQCFLLTYKHPEYGKDAEMLKNNLIEMNDACKGNDKSFYNACNLKGALFLVKDWEAKFESNDVEITEYKYHVSREINQMTQAKRAGISYIPRFPRYLLQTVCNSDVFIYPMLLPRVPFKPSIVFGQKSCIIESESRLIAHGLEQFLPFLKFDKTHLNKRGDVRLMDACTYISQYLMPSRPTIKIYRFIISNKNATFMNPIRQYFEKNSVTPPVHFVTPLEHFLILPPCQRSVDLLPHQWREYLYPSSTITRLPEHSTIASQLAEAIPDESVNKRKTLNGTLKNKLVKRKKVGQFSYEKSDVVISTVKPSDKLNGDFSTTTFSFSITRNDVKSTQECRNKKILLDCNVSKFVGASLKHIYLSKDWLQVTFSSTIFLKIMPINIDEAIASGGMDLFSENLDDNVSFQNKKLNDIILEVVPNDYLSDNQLIPGDHNEVVKDNLDDINALMLASTTIKSNEGKRKQTGAEKKRAKLKKDYNASLRMLVPEEEDAIAEKTDRFVQAFYDKVRERLDMHDYHKFIEILNNFDEKFDSVTDLYNHIERIISSKHPDILDEFLTFFTSLQAKSMGKLIPHLVMNNMALFLHKLEMIFKDQPSQVRKIYRSLTELVAMKNVTMEHVKCIILPLLKGNNLLIDWFLQIFPTEKPPNRLMRGAWENIELTTDDQYEMITIPDLEDPYGGITCICQCHNVIDPIFKSRSKHCIPCGTKFMQGRVYVQTGKGLRLAKVTFENSSIDHTSRLACKVKTKRRDLCPVKQISPGKDSQCSSDDEPDKKRLSKTTKKRKPKNVVPKVTLERSVPENKEVVIEKEVERVKPIKMEQVNDNTSDSSVNEIKTTLEENVEWDCNTSIESIELKMSAESESEFCEETSQDNNSDSVGSESEHDVQWTRDEDKAILQTFQKEADKDVAFEKIANILDNRTIGQIKQRFETLMNLLRTMTKNNKV